MFIDKYGFYRMVYSVMIFGLSLIIYVCFSDLVSFDDILKRSVDSILQNKVQVLFDKVLYGVKEFFKVFNGVR